MATVGKNIRLFRSEAKINQAALAERLHVTPQTVSSWETGRTRPDVDTLENISSALDVDLIELIYGRQPKEVKPFMKYQKKYIVWTAVLGVLAVVLLIIVQNRVPGMLKIAFTHMGDMQYFGSEMPLSMVWAVFYAMFFGAPLMFAAVGALVPAAISLWKDIRIKNSTIRIILPAVALVLFIIYAISPSTLFAYGAAPKIAQTIMIFGLSNVWIFAPMGAMACLGLNR